MTPILKLGRGGAGTIARVSGHGALAQRLMALGFLPGVPVRIVQVAPFGDPITVEVDGWRVSLRLSDAEGLLVRPFGEGEGP